MDVVGHLGPCQESDTQRWQNCRTEDPSVPIPQSYTLSPGPLVPVTCVSHCLYFSSQAYPITGHYREKLGFTKGREGGERKRGRGRKKEGKEK